MFFKRLTFWTVLFSLLLVSCGKGNPTSNGVPPPPTVNPGGDDTEEPGDETDTPKPWDENRGKVVRPKAGNGWTVTPVSGYQGVTYYAFDGTEPVSKRKQRIFVTDVDLSKGYSLKLAYYNGNNIASRIFKSTGAVAVINAGYEKTAIWCRVNGTNIGWIQYDRIGKDNDKPVEANDVPQWKSEAAVYLNQDQDVRIRFSGRDKNLAEWRALYSAKCYTENNFITSAPMLISDYEPVGTTFCDLHPRRNSSSEDPYNHQASTSNPRTAIATTEDGHVLFIVVDGRRTVSTGISALELTTFLVNNFNPQYAINLDGGGSSAMCVAGQGDPDTHVVNYPCDNKDASKEIKIGSETIVWPKESNGPDHKGERARDTFFYIVKK